MDNQKKTGKFWFNKKIKTEPKNDEDRWVFESLVGFLTGPIWNMPLTDFMENKCFEFENVEGDQAVFEKLHKEYKHLVDLLLSSFMQDLGISAQQFEKACLNARTEEQNGLSQIRQTLLEQICAAEDSEVFVHMMVQKNKELQLQTLRYLQNLAAPIQESNADEFTKFVADENDEELQNVIRQSLKEHKALKAQINKEKEEMMEIMENTLAEEKRRLEEENRIETEMLKKAMKLSLEEFEDVKEKSEIPKLPAPVLISKPKLAEITNRKESLDLKSKQELIQDGTMQLARQTENNISTDKTPPKNEGISEMEISSRQAYLRQQRDKIVALNRNVRKLKIDQLEECSSQKRPKSARAAKNAMENNDESNVLDPDVLAARQALARRLKTEVVAQHTLEN